MRRLLLDANKLILALDPASDGSSAAAIEAQQLLNDPQTQASITPLIRHEVLRGVGWTESQRHHRLKQALDSFDSLTISEAAAELATKLYRFNANRPQGSRLNLDKRSFDLLHFAVAKVEDIDLASNDKKDMQALDRLYLELPPP